MIYIQPTYETNNHRETYFHIQLSFPKQKQKATSKWNIIMIKKLQLHHVSYFSWNYNFKPLMMDKINSLTGHTANTDKFSWIGNLIINKL